jgi:hypothetical protein
LTRINAEQDVSLARNWLHTVSVRLADGSFVGKHDDDMATIRRGQDLAASMSMERLHAADIRISIDRPMEATALAGPRDILREIADRSGAVVWGPPRGGYCAVVTACADLAAVNGDGTAAQWHHYQAGLPRPLRTRPTRTVAS